MLAHKNPDEHRSLGLFGLLRKESWGAKETTKQKGKGRVTFALPRSDSKKKAALALAKAAEVAVAEERWMGELAPPPRQQEDGAGTGNHGSGSADVVAADCVETVDMAVHTEGGLGLTPAAGLGVGEDCHPPVLLPPPDMFDDVHYMHSGPADLSRQDSREDGGVDEGPPPPLLQVSARPHPRSLSTFGTPRSKATPSAPGPASRGAGTPSGEEPNPYLCMQPVIVDSSSSKKDAPLSRGNVDLHTLGETVSPHFDSVSSFRPTKGQAAAPVASPEKFSPDRLQGHDPEKPSEAEVPKESLRPIPARRRLLEQSGPGGRSASPRPAWPDAMSPSQDVSGSPCEVTYHRTLEAASARAYLMSPRTDVEQVGHRVSSSQQSSRSGSAADVNAPSPVSSPSPIHPSPSPLFAGQQEGAPRYTSPPSYAKAVGHRQGQNGPGKSCPSPSVYSAGTPTAGGRSSPPAANTPRKLSAPCGPPVLRGTSKEPGHLPGARDTPRDLASTLNLASRNGSPSGPKETPPEVDGLYSSVPLRSESSSFSQKAAAGKSSPNGASQTPRDTVVSPAGGKPPTPRERSNSYGTRLAPRSHSGVHQTVVSPRDSSCPYGGFPETPRNTTQGQGGNRVSASVDTVTNVKDGVTVIEQTMRTPRSVVQNGSVAYPPPYTSASPAKAFHGHTTPRVLSPRESPPQWSQSTEVLSPRPSGSGQGQKATSSTVVVAVDVHPHPPQPRTTPSARSPFPRPLSATLDSAVFSEQTVTFV